MATYRTRIASTALLMGLSLSAACDSPTASNGGGTPAPTQPTQPAEVSSVQISPDTITLLEWGGHRPVRAAVRDRFGELLQGRYVRWSTSDATVALVDDSGNVTALRPGRAWITATVDGKQAQARVDVLPLTVDSIAMSRTWMQVPWGTVRSAGVNVYAADGRELSERVITWTTSDPSVAIVDPAGDVMGIKGGRAWVTATSEGKSARMEIIVPDVKVMTLVAADGRALPVTVQDTLIHGEGTAVRHVEVVATNGMMALHSILGLYTQRVTLRTTTRTGHCMEWGSCIWDATETVTEREAFDRGTIGWNLFSGDPIFESTITDGLDYYAERAPNDGFTVWQQLQGTNVRLPWLYQL